MCIIALMVDFEGERMMCVDWGRKRIGLAISDPTLSLAYPLTTIQHVSRQRDAEVVIEKAEEVNAGLIIVGVTYDENNELTPSGRSASRFAEELRSKTNIQIKLWDEESTTTQAKTDAVIMNLPKSKRKGHLDAMAAAIGLQNYLNKFHHEEKKKKNR